jgi:hypothetical protein
VARFHAREMMCDISLAVVVQQYKGSPRLQLLLLFRPPYLILLKRREIIAKFSLRFAYNYQRKNVIMDSSKSKVVEGSSISLRAQQV